MSFNRLGSIFHKLRASAVFPPIQSRFHANCTSSSSYLFALHFTKKPQQPQKRSFHQGTIQNGLAEWRNVYNNTLSTRSSSSRLQETPHSFRNDAMPCDVMIYVQGTTKAGTFKVHKFVLGVHSERFRKMWNMDAQSYAPEDVIQFPGVEPHAFAIMMRYMYAADTSKLTMENVMDVLFCARVFEANKFTQICHDFIEVSLTDGNACHVLRQARLMGDDRMAQLALSTICKSPDSAFASREFLQLSPLDVQAILDRNDLNMPETLIYHHVRRWALDRMCQPDANGKNLRDIIGNLRFAIRFPLFDKGQLDSGPVKDGVIVPQELDVSASPVSDPSHCYPSTPRIPAPAPFYISCLIGCDAFGKDQDDWATSRVVIELCPEFAPHTCVYVRKLLELVNTMPCTSEEWYHVRLVPCDGFFIDYHYSKRNLEPPEAVSQETSILSPTVPGAVCFGWEGSHCLLYRGPGFQRSTGEPVYSIWLADGKPDGGAVFGRVVHGLDVLKSAYGHFLAGKVSTSGVDYWSTNWCLHDDLPDELY